MSDRSDAIRAFRRALQRGVAERVVETPHGVGLFCDSIPDVYDANFVSVEDVTVGAAELAADAGAAMEGHRHRRVLVERGTAGLAGDFAQLGYELSTHLVLEHRERPDRRVDTTVVREVALADLAAARRAAALAEPWADEDIVRQLEEAKRRVVQAVPTRFFAAVVKDEPVAWCELRSDGRVAQIEDVEVRARFRGRGLGRAIVQHALDEARREHEVVWLEALADDWPRVLYAKLGFRVVGTRDLYTRLPHPTMRLRLRTPRLELRRPTVAELRELYRVAAAGIHDPAVMPFEVPWTDDLNEPDFLEFLSRDAADDLRFVAFCEGRPVGVQGIRLELPRVDTGSWLGAAHQGRGLGTEMRAAVLSLAFDHLGAEVARSGALAGNPQSLGVSRKLGYRVTGSRFFSPRGEPVEHTDLELRREDFVSPVPVEVDGLSHLLPLLRP